jgi:hypothetical protein
MRWVNSKELSLKFIKTAYRFFAQGTAKKLGSTLNKSKHARLSANLPNWF